MPKPQHLGSAVVPITAKDVRREYANAPLSVIWLIKNSLPSVVPTLSEVLAARALLGVPEFARLMTGWSDNRQDKIDSLVVR